MREASASLEGIGVSVLGHLDRILEPYYHNDLMEGRITREETKDLICFFLAMSDVRFEMRKVRPHVGTNTTVVIGGCDARGNIVFNDITRMIKDFSKVLSKYQIDALLFGHLHHGKKWNGCIGYEKIPRIYDAGTTTMKQGFPGPHRVLDLKLKAVYDYDGDFHGDYAILWRLSLLEALSELSGRLELSEV